MPSTDTACTEDDLADMVAHMVAVCPPPKGTRVNVEFVEPTELEACWASTSKSGRTFSIEIARGLTKMEAEALLIHEWSHVLDWRQYHTLFDDHGPSFGVCWALVYQRYTGLR